MPSSPCSDTQIHTHAHTKDTHTDTQAQAQKHYTGTHSNPHKYKQGHMHEHPTHSLTVTHKHGHVSHSHTESHNPITHTHTQSHSDIQGTTHARAGTWTHTHAKRPTRRGQARAHTLKTHANMHMDRSAWAGACTGYTPISASPKRGRTRTRSHASRTSLEMSHFTGNPLREATPAFPAPLSLPAHAPCHDGGLVAVRRRGEVHVVEGELGIIASGR